MKRLLLIAGLGLLACQGWAQNPPPSPVEGPYDQLLQSLGNLPAPIDPSQYAKLLECLGTAHPGADAFGTALAYWMQTDPEVLPRFLQGDGHPPDEATLLRVVECLPLGSVHGYPDPSIPLFYKELCAPIYQAHGDDLAYYRSLGPRARIVMSAYLGTRGKLEEIKTLMASLTTEERQTLGTTVSAVIGETVAVEHTRATLPVTLWGWEDYATRLGGEAPAAFCWDMMIECEMAGDQEVMASEVIPWTEAHLADPGAEGTWACSISALIRDYDFIGQPEKAVARGEYWLAQAAQCPSVAGDLSRAKFYLALALEKTDYQRAAQMWRELAAHQGDKMYAEAAQEELLKLAQAHPDLTNVELLPAEFKGVWPEKVLVQAQFGEGSTRKIMAQGSATLLIIAGSCDLAGATVTVGEKQLSGGGSSQAITLTLGGLDKVGPQDGNLLLATNDPQHGRVTVPVHVEVASPLRVSPESLFFGFVKPGETKTCVVTISGTMPFQVKEVRADKPDLVTVTVRAQSDRSYEIAATLQAPKGTGPQEGAVEVMMDLPGQPLIRVEYFGDMSS